MIEQLVIGDYILVELSLEVQGGQDYFRFVEGDVAYLRISKVSIYISSPQGLVRHHGLFDINYHFKLIK